ncbi:Planctomycete cytochrome C [Geopseudomonas sagittaria]|uniref:Planctomycete cytochrome C n=1 Tax=Geopseudomonas sagittaria TaxID=1135990 RepID=A0A1I5UW11_9GAMM|nr:c-type cytochrome domain-containing protein [Pseudomonas sagittaria]MCM2330760.1 hypothetical protein [Pseudomonas sagittaria]SFP99433.1 Planctomycete cytochrome C [Pseudomonas sagittaria]
MPALRRRLPLLGLLLAATASQAQPVTYAELAPLLQTRCVLCHSGSNAPLGLRLDSIAGLLAGSQRGPVVLAGKPQDSELLQRLTGSRQPRMPMTGPPFLSDAEIALFERWIADGLPAGSEAAGAGSTPASPPPPASGAVVTYAQVAPILARRCAKCHAAQGLMGPPPEGLRLTSYAETLASSERARVVPGAPEASELLRRIRGQARPRMPYDGPPWLDEAEIALIATWIEQGARNAEGQPAPSPSGARLRLHGTLGANWTLDGLPLRVNAGTRIDKSPRPGDYVQVRGHWSAGNVEVERLRRR